jgi:hypothetical protein
MERQRALHLPHRLGRNSRDEQRHETALHPMKAEQAANVLIHGIADPRRFGIRGEAGQFRDVVERMWRHDAPSQRREARKLLWTRIVRM